MSVNIQLNKFRNLIGANPIVLVMKIVLILVLVWIYSMWIPILDFEIIEFSKIFQLIESLRNIISWALYNGLFYLMLGLGTLSGLAFGLIPLFGSYSTSSIINMIFKNVFINWFPNLARTDPVSGVVTQLSYESYDIMGDVEILTQQVYILIFQIIFILMIIAAVRSIIQNDPKHSIRTITYLNMMLVIPLVLIGFEEMINVFADDFSLSEIINLCTDASVTPLPEGEHLLPYPLISDVLYEEITSDIGAFLTGNIFQIALSSFIYMELSFQLNYVYQVTSPTEKRASRLKYQIEALKRAAKEAVVDIENIQQEQKELEEKEELDENGNIIKKKKQENVRKFLTSTSSGFSYISEMIEKRKLEEETKKLIEAKQDTRRLSNYLNKLLINDPEAEHTLTARASAPTAGRLVLSTVLDMAFRIFGITLIVFFVAQTVWVMTTVLNAPDSIANSVEMLTKEVILTLLIPIILFFPLLSFVIRGTKQSHLKQKLKDEEMRRLEAQGYIASPEEREAEKAGESEPIVTA